MVAVNAVSTQPQPAGSVGGQNQPSARDVQQFGAKMAAAVSAKSRGTEKLGDTPHFRPSGERKLSGIPRDDGGLAADGELNTSVDRPPGAVSGAGNKGGLLAPDLLAAFALPTPPIRVLGRSGYYSEQDFDYSDSSDESDGPYGVAAPANTIYQVAAPANTIGIHPSNEIGRLTNAIEAAANTIRTNMNMPDLRTTMYTSNNYNAFRLDLITFMPDSAQSQENQLRYILDRVQDMAIWATTAPVRAALREGFASTQNIVITPTGPNYPVDERVYPSADGHTLAIAFNGSRSRWVTDRYGNPFTPDWCTAQGCPTTVPLFHEYLHCLRIIRGDNYVDIPVYANNQRLNLAEVMICGLGQYANERLTENRLRAALNLPLRTFYTTLAETNLDGSYPYVTYYNWQAATNPNPRTYHY